MALSGSIIKNIGSHNRLQIDWTATQDIANNKSIVTSKFWLGGIDQYGEIRASSTRTGTHKINGNSVSFTNTSAVGANSWKLLHTHVVEVPHNADGTKTFNITGTYDLGVTLSGDYYGVQTLSKDFTLNPIPRASKITSKPTWTAGNSVYVSVSSASSAFRHVAVFWVKNASGGWVEVARSAKFATSITHTFTDAQNKTIFQCLAGEPWRQSCITIETYNGSTFIGEQDEAANYDWVYAPNASTLSLPSSVDITKSLTGTILTANTKFSHRVRLTYTTAVGSKTYHEILPTTPYSNASSFTLDTNTIKNDLYAQCPNAQYWNGKITIWTYFDGVQVQSPKEYTVKFNVIDSKPTYTVPPTYKDIDTITTTLTQNPSLIIQGKSKVQVTIPASSKAVAKNGATMSHYVITLAGKSESRNYSTSDIVVVFNEIQASSDTTLTVKAVDSRGFSTEVYTTVTVLPYSPPTLTASAKRKSGFEDLTTISLTGTFSTLNGKNSLQKVQYRWKKNTDTSFSSWDSFTYTTSGTTFTATPETQTFESTSAYTVEYSVTDKLGTVTVQQVVSEGVPILFIDSKKKSIGVGKFPSSDNTLETAGATTIGGNASVSGTLTVNGSSTLKGNLNMSSKNISSVNLLSTKDITATGQATIGGKAIKVSGNTLLFDNKPIALSDSAILWEGAYWMRGDHYVYPTKKMSECPNGWILVFTYWTGSQQSNSNFTYCFVHKTHALTSGIYFLIGDNNYNPMFKYIYVGDDYLRGHDSNDDGAKAESVLFRVLAW
ncbi:DUF859 domain-containing protein [Neobacillus sedimentimangrovi]|uniref:DUF859 domain-containing protein n=1 Tax=Neobacillus sedimentimangrovi TaxID=2699460 RepID=A0ABS8QN82_9BACI|nr:DUF859 domain-containing protein [Neobacillus sedimentimangrovi]MCD4839759.1 DUF859 domain-containing protein [Neobacillus sedimentimangrovi]